MTKPLPSCYACGAKVKPWPCPSCHGLLVRLACDLCHVHSRLDEPHHSRKRPGLHTQPPNAGPWMGPTEHRR